MNGLPVTPSHGVGGPFGIEGQIEVAGGRNQTKVGKGLGEVSQLFTRMRNFFSI